MQSLCAAMLVIGCSGYAVWKLMPSAWRRSLAGAALKLPLPQALHLRVRKAATTRSGCGCDGCDHAAPKAARTAATAAPAAQRIVFHPRPRP